MVSIGQAGMISMRGHGENQGSNLMGSKYNAFSLIIITLNAPSITGFDD
jgi:hypothetical protein